MPRATPPRRRCARCSRTSRRSPQEGTVRMAKKPPAVALRPPPAPVDPRAADRFVDAGTQTSERRNIQPPKRSRTAARRGPPRGLVARRDGRTLKRMTVYLPADLAKRLAL